MDRRHVNGGMRQGLCEATQRGDHYLLRVMTMEVAFVSCQRRVVVRKVFLDQNEGENGQLHKWDGDAVDAAWASTADVARQTRQEDLQGEKKG